MNTPKDFLTGFARATGLDLPTADAQWAVYSRHLSDSERETVEVGGESAGAIEGARYSTDLADVSPLPEEPGLFGD